MRVSKLQIWVALAAIALVMIATPASHAQTLNSTAQPVTLTGTLAESLTVTLSASAVNFALVPSGTANGSTPVNVTTTWALAGTHTSLALYAYFASANALSSGANNIPTANFYGAINGGAMSPYTGGSSPFGSAANSKTVFTLSPLTGQFGGTRTDALTFQINTTGLALPAGTYTGTLNIQAQAL